MFRSSICCRSRPLLFQRRHRVVSAPVCRSRRSGVTPSINRRLATTKEDNNSGAELLILQIEKHLLGESSGLSPTRSSLKSWVETLSQSQRDELSRKITELELSASETLTAAAAATSATTTVVEPTQAELRLVALNNAIPFVGFGIMDNSLLIIFGDAIDTSLGVALGISTMCAAAIGNIISDVAGVMFGTVIEDWAARLNLPTPNLSAAQRQLRSVRYAHQAGCGIGLTIGCIIGMFPLMFIDSNKIQARKREAHLDAIFRDVVTEAGSLVGADQICLYIKVDEKTMAPSAQGKHLYARYDAEASSKGRKVKERLVPLGRGIISRAALTGEAWKIDKVEAEPDYDPTITPEAQSMLCVPVLDGQGQILGVLQAINKVGRGLEDVEASEDSEVRPSWITAEQIKPATSKPRAFTEPDVQILKALASHIAVSVQTLYENDEEEEELRLRDTIRIMKEYGLAGLSNKEVPALKTDHTARRRQSLFPED